MNWNQEKYQGGLDYPERQQSAITGFGDSNNKLSSGMKSRFNAGPNDNANAGLDYYGGTQGSGGNNLNRPHNGSGETNQNYGENQYRQSGAGTGNSYGRQPANERQASPFAGIEDILAKIGNQTRQMPPSQVPQNSYSQYQPANNQNITKALADMDWGKLGKIETAQRIFPAEVLDAYLKPEVIEKKIFDSAQLDKAKVDLLES